jgi:hypothetical protein
MAPNYPETHVMYAGQLLLLGHLQDGFREYEWRRFDPAYRPFTDRYPENLWTGQMLEGKTIVLFGEHGFSDTLQFVRYAKLVKQRGGRVVIEAPQPMRRLLAAQDYIDAVFDPEDERPKWDFFAPLLSLPHIFGTTLETIPSEVPYLVAETLPTPVAIAAAPPGLNVGLVWAGSPAHPNDRRRSMDLSYFEPLGGLEGINWFSLQTGAAAAQLHPGSRPVFADLGVSLKDVADTAAVLKHLDLVITVDTATAHLAGALGIPCWVLLQEHPDWRWLLGREDSPWYPSVRLFRQEQFGTWEPVIARVRTQLAAFPRKASAVGDSAAAPVSAAVSAASDPDKPDWQVTGS